MTTVATAKMVDMKNNRQHSPTSSYENHDVFAIFPGDQCETKFDFITNNDGDLSFKKGEVLTILQASRDPNWYKAKNAEGKQGMVPVNYVTKRSDQYSESEASDSPEEEDSPHEEVKLRAMPWFHGKISRQEAESMLQPRKDGLFLVRESVNFPGDFTVCVCFEGDVEHYRIIYQNNSLTIDEEDYFENLTQLVEFYQDDANGLVSELIIPLQKQSGWEFSVNPDDFRDAGWAVQLEELKLGSILGKGDFGDVYQGTFRGEKVAVKSVKDRTKAAQAFLAEASIMTALCHKNLVQLRGVVLPEKLSNDPIYVIIEFMTKGAMLEYLRSRGRALVSSKDLLKFAKHVARGMEYVEKKNLVHRDLAARNVLISDDCIAKVSDFGLARDASFNLQGGKFPVKWTAPEALKDGKFSNKSDVWSYGVTMWEMWSFGRVPYPRVPLKDLLSKVERGYRMDCPERCEKSVYQLMRQCWHADPNKRPSFREVVKELKEIKLS